MKSNFGYYLTEEQIEHITNRWNESYVERILAVLRLFSSKWRLSNIQLIPFYSQNCLFTCYSEMYGDAVIKVGYHSLANEFNCLREFAGRNTCEVFDADLSHNVILEQRIAPGSSLLNEDNQDRRIDIFVSLFEGLHIVPRNEKPFMTIQDIAYNKLAYIQTREDCKFFSRVYDKARVVFESVISKYNDKKLLHGDLHHDNILLTHNGTYLIIDANGYVGDPIFDVSRFIMLEFGDDLTGKKDGEILNLIKKLEVGLHIPSDILIKCLFIENVLWLCSDLERGETVEESQFIIDNIVVVKRLLDQYC